MGTPRNKLFLSQSFVIQLQIITRRLLGKRSLLQSMQLIQGTEKLLNSEEMLGGHDHLSEKQGEAGPPGGDKRLKVTDNGNLPDEEEFSEALKNPNAPAGSIMSSSERQVADVLGPQAFVGITGGTDTLETLWVETSDVPPPSMANCSQDCVMIENENDGSSTSSVLFKDSSCLGDDLQIDKVTDALSSKKRKKTLSDAQLEYFEVATSYYRMKKRKLELEIEALIAKKKEE
ncbi:uncharacterized protein [Acropora muricata]|uniref:uncharacterized protein isoform X2 n=1 Tax=Acropora muricata TaxID=159855 RepID=UPI0034E5B392